MPPLTPLDDWNNLLTWLTRAFPLWPLLSSLTSPLNLVSSLLPLCRPVILNYPVPWLQHVACSSLYLKHLCSNYLPPFRANVHSFVRFQPKHYLLQKVFPDIYPTPHWSTSPCNSLYFLHLSSWVLLIFTHQPPSLDHKLADIQEHAYFVHF